MTSLNPPGGIRFGTVGPAAPGVRVRIADDGEILVKGLNVSPGYWQDEAATAELFDDDGWMRTGDLGSLDADGYLTITGRKKDLIINAAGKNISPQEIETRLRYEPLVSQAVVVGDGRPYLTALLTLDAEAVAEWAERHGRASDVEALVDDPQLCAAVERSVEAVNDEHARVEGIKKWRILPTDLTDRRRRAHPDAQGEAQRGRRPATPTSSRRCTPAEPGCRHPPTATTSAKPSARLAPAPPGRAPPRGR